MNGRLCCALVLAFLWSGCQGRESASQLPGPQRDGSVLLPNRWSLTPAGEQIEVGDLPLGLALSPDDRYLAVTNNGYAEQYVAIIDLASREETQRIPMAQSWLGLAFNGAGDRLYVSGGGLDRVEAFRFEEGKAERLASFDLKEPDDEEPYFVSGLALTEDGRWLLAAALRRHCLVRFDLFGESGPEEIAVGPYPYGVVVHPSDATAFVSNWGDRSVSVIDLTTASEERRIAVGSHPNAMVLSADGSLLYVTNANSNDLSIIDVAAAEVVQTLDLSPYEGAPSGSTPNGLAISPDGTTLFVVNADNNDVAVVDLSRSPARVEGLIPTGWYPTAVTVTRDGGTILIANGKGLGSKPNPRGPRPTVNYPDRLPELQYIGRLFLGTVSVLAVPGENELARYTERVMANNGFERTAEELRAGARAVAPRAIPRRAGEPSLLRYVFYIIKENRTYDQVLGDLPQGEGDASLTLFGREITPNHHALAETFVLLDNFYVDAEVSADGHEWSTAGIATDFVEKLWPTNYSGRDFPMPLYLFEMAFPDAGHLWDAAARAGLSYRSYGEYVNYGPNGSYPVETRIEVLQGHIAPRYPGIDLTVRDGERADAFIDDFERLLAAGEVPRLNILQLPGDHTRGTRPGERTPRAMVADNDLALGRIVEAIAASPIWKESAIFVVEDDSQNGPDHIDSHRTVALLASPFARRGFVDHTMYDTVSLLKTIELILGLEPMSQYDAAALPIFAAFQDEPDPTPYVALPNRVDLDELNGASSYGAEQSMRMNLEELDAAPEELLNEILWKSIRGADSEMPAPHTTRPWIDL